MKKYLLLLLTVFALNSCEQDPEIIGVDAAKQLPKVDVCHYDATIDTWETINISENALKAHLGHGDIEGSCEDRKTYVPDDSFETYLICQGYDEGPLDDYVLTSKIDKIEVLNLPYDGGSDCGFGEQYDIAYLTGIEDFISLKVLKTGAGLMKTLDLSTLTELETLRIYSGQFLESLNISMCSKLEYLYLGKTGDPTGLKHLDVSNNPKLKKIDMENMQKFEGMDFSNLIDLEQLTIHYVKSIPIIDLSNSTLLSSVSLSSITGINEINLRNGNNSILTNVFLIDLNYLTQSLCVQVDDPSTFIAEWTSVDPWTTFSEDCSAEPERTYIPDDIFELYLIRKGYDALPLDDYVLTSKIDKLTEFYIPHESGPLT